MEDRMTYMQGHIDLCSATWFGKDLTRQLNYNILCLCGEAGEVANELKKIIRDGNAMTAEQRTKLLEELTDVHIYLMMCFTSLYGDPYQSWLEKQEKLYERWGKPTEAQYDAWRAGIDSEFELFELGRSSNSSSASDGGVRESTD
jgi:NTP pyrophosphatase (non-canonical NTP hydrolase)